MMDQHMYRIRVQGHAGPLWSEWFAGLSVENLDNGDAILWGMLPDQAALYGVLGQLRDLGVPLLAVQRACLEEQGRPTGVRERP